METELVSSLRGEKKAKWESLLQSFSLATDEELELTALVWEGEELAATASLCGSIIKCVAVSAEHQGEGLTAVLITALRNAAAEKGISHLFLYTKPENLAQFSDFFFYPIAQTDDILLMENRKNGISEHLASYPDEKPEGLVGACVMNCNPFTKGHRYLIETAAKQVDKLFVFVLSEDKSLFPASVRLKLVKDGVSDLQNVTVLPSGPYLLSSATFPNYFLKNRDTCEKAHCALDIEIFAKYYAPRFNITRRFVGSEPLSALTAQYNDELKASLPKKGIEVCEIPRLCAKNEIISATKVRELLHTGEEKKLRELIPDVTYTYLKENDLI